MAIRFLSDEEMFGGKAGNLGATVKDASTTTPAKSSIRMLSDEEMFGTAIEPEKSTSRTVMGTAGDLVNAASHGVTAAAQGLVGFADLAGGLVGGRGEIGKFLDTNEFSVENGLRFKDINKKLDDMFQSEAQKAADKRVDQVDGFWDTAVAMGQNPSTILKGVVESLPAMYTGAKVGGAVTFIANKLPAGLAKFAPSIAAKLGVIGDAGAAAIGEGIISGGQTAEQIRAESKDGTITGGQQLISAGSGLLTAGLSGISNKIGARFGIDDSETAMVRGTLRAKNEAANLASKPWYRRALEQGIKEGVIEELPQSAQEQMAQNWAQDKPIMEGVGKAAAQGLLTGFTQGGGHSALTGLVGRNRTEPTPDSPSRQFTQSAFADVAGDDAVRQQQQIDRSSIALSLSQLDDAELKTATTHLAGGNEQLQQLLTTVARDPETVKNYESVVGHGSLEYLQVADQIRRDSGITVDDTSNTPTAATAVNSAIAATDQQQTTAVDPTVATNSAGFKVEPIAQLQAQLLAMADGRKPGVVMGVEEAAQLRDAGALAGFAEGTATDPSGTEAVFVGKDNEAVNAVVTRASEVGIKQAAGEFLLYANPTATTDVPPNATVVQQIDDSTGHILDEQIVTPEQAVNIKRIPGTSIRSVPVTQALFERNQSVQDEQSTAVTPDATAVEPVSQQQEQFSVPQADQTQQSQPQAQASEAVIEPVAQTSVQDVQDVQSEPAPLRQQTTETSTATPRMQDWVDSFNASKGIAQDSPQQVDASSIREFAPQKGSALSKIAAAVKEAFGVNVVFVETPHGALMRKDGTKYNKFSGFVDLRNQSLVLNVDAATPLNTLGHELAHLLQVSFPDIYSKLELSVLSRMSYQQAKAFKDGLQNALNQEGDKASIEQEFRSEVVAEALGEMAQEQSFWADVFSHLGEDQAQAKTLYDTIMQVLAKLAKAFTKHKFIPGVKDMQKVRRAATDAFIEWSARIENPNNLGPESRQMYEQFQKESGSTQTEAKTQEAPKVENVHMFGRDFPKTLEDNDPLLRNTVEINTPERIALRNQIIDSHFEGRATVHYGKPSITLLGGGGGVGKSTVLKFMQRVLKTVQMDHTLVKINADDIKVILPEYGQIRDKGDWRAATTVHAESSLISKAIQYRALGMTSDDVAPEFKPYMPSTSHGKYDILLDATMSDAKKGKALVEDANGRGYHVKLIAVVANPESAIERAYERGKKSGRYVPDEVVAEAHAGFLSAIELYSNVVDDFSLWDNDVPLNSPAIQKGVNDEQYRQTIAGYVAAAQRLGATSSGQTGNIVTGGKESAVAGSAGGQRQAGEGTGQEQSQHGLAGGLTQFSRDSIQRAIDGKRTGPLLVSEKPPAKLAKFLDDLPVTISDEVIRKVASGKNGVRSTFTAKQIESLTQLLENPAAVFQSASRDDSIVVLTSLVINGEPVIAAVERGSNRTYTVDITPTKSRQIEFKSNAINSSYPKDLTGIRNWIASGRLLQWDKNLTGKPGFPQTIHAWLAQGARVMGRPVPSLKTESAGTLDKVDAPIAPTVQQNQPTTSIVPKPTGIVNESGRKTLTLKKTQFMRDMTSSEDEDSVGFADESNVPEASSYKITENKDGSILIHGDAEEIRFMLPPGVIGKVTDQGLAVGSSQAPTAKAALSGDDVVYGRAGKVTTNQRYQNGDRKGQYIGAPDPYNNPNKIVKLRKILQQLAKEGKSGRFWYEESGKSVMAFVGGDIAEAKKFISLLAIYSPQAKVNANTTMALSAWEQYKAGLPISTKTAKQDKQAENVLRNNKQWGGEKTNNFYKNLMREVDLAVGHPTMQGATIDMWMMRAAGYENDESTSAQYRFMENETNLLAKELGWEPQQVQAAIWVAIKARTENKGVKERTEARSTRYGFMHMEPGSREKDVRKVDWPIGHRAVWLQEAFKHDVTAADEKAAAYHFGTALVDRSAQVSSEATPGVSTNILPGIHSAPVSQQQEYLRAVIAALKDENGRDIIDAEIGALVNEGIEGNSGWDGSVSVGTQKQAPVYRTGTGEVSTVSRALLELGMSIRGLLTHQEGMAWHIPIFKVKGSKYSKNGMDFHLGRSLNNQETAVLYQAISDELGHTYSPPIPTEKGFRVLNFPDAKRWLKTKGVLSALGKKTFKKESTKSNADFHKAVRKAIAKQDWAAEAKTALLFESDGRLIDNNWSNGDADYRRAISDQLKTADRDGNRSWGGRSNIFQWIDGDLAPRITKVNQAFAEKYGWGEPTRFSRTEDAQATPRLAEPAGRPSIGSSTGQRGSTVSQAIHYGKQAGLSNLSGSIFGTGIKGAELERLNKPGVDPRIKKRVYFYLPVEGGIPASESGLGGNVYSADLKNMYDPDGSVKGEGNAFESAVLDAGYKGYMNRMQGTAVVLNSDVPVRYLGTSDQFNKVQRLIQRIVPKVETRTEGNETVRKMDNTISLKAKEAAQIAAPSFKQQYGEARVATNEKNAANEALSASGSDFQFSRNATKQMTAQESLDYATTGKLQFTLGDALRHWNFADAFMLAKNKDERKQLLSNIGDSVIHSMADGLIPVQRWIEKLPMSNLVKQRLQGDIRRAETLRSAKEKEVTSKFSEEMYKAVEVAAKKTKRTTDQIKKDVGLWMTAKYAPKANQHLITRDRTALIKAQAEVAAAARELAAAQQARVASRMPGVAGSVVSAAALRLANAQKRDADAVPKLADARRELAERLADVNSAIGTQGFVRGVAGGYNNAMAAKIVSEIEGRVDPQLLAAVAKPMYAMLAWKKSLDLTSGKVTQSMVNSWPNHADYVPLTGDPRYDKDSSDVFQYGNQLNQDADQQLNGRKTSVADDAIDAAYTAVMKSINFSAFQDFKRSLNDAYESAQRNGQDIGLTRGPVTGIMGNNDDVIIYRDATSNGMKAYALKFKDQAIIEAIKKGNHETLNRFLNIFAVPTRWYGRLVTQFAPAFAPINFMRDLWERSEFLRVRNLYDRNGNKVDTDKAARAGIFHAFDYKTWQASAQVNFDTKGQGSLRSMLQQMIDLGGSSTWGDYLAKAATALEADIRKNTGSITRGVNKTVEKIGAWNNTFEMIAPLSIYRALLEQNMTEKDAAAATLDLMNFRKKGTVMPGIRALYVFAQPAATSGYNLAQYLATPKGRKRFAAYMMLGTVLYALLRGAWGDDDDEELGNNLDNLPNFTVERSIPVKMGDMMVKVPVGFGPPQLAWAMAGILNRWYSGRYDGTTALLEGGKAWVKSVAPINPSDLEISKRPVDWMMTSIFPTVARPILNIFADQTGMGMPLTPQFKNDKKMNFEQSKRTTPQLFSDMAESLHEMTGWDVFPDHIKALSDGYMIGPMMEIMSYFVDNPSKEMRGEKGRIPIVASLVDNIRDRQLLNNVYYRERDAIAGVAKEYESRMARNDLADWITPEKTQQLMAFKQFKSQELMFGHMRNNLVKAKLDPEMKSIQLQAIEEQADNARRRVLVTFLQNKEKP